MLEQEVMISSLMWGWIAVAKMSAQEATTAKGTQWKYNYPFFFNHWFPSSLITGDFLEQKKPFAIISWLCSAATHPIIQFH